MSISAPYESRLFSSLDRLKKKLASYIDDPENSKNVHDVRTSLRRLDVMFSMLPKKVRRRNRKHIRNYKELFKTNSRLRDIDVIRAKVAAHSPDARSLDAPLQRRRNAQVKKAIKMARALRKQPRIRIKVAPAKLESRIDKITDNLCSRIKQTMPVVLADARKVDELHRLRKDCKKLRYVIEALPAGAAKKYEKKATDALGKEAGVLLLEKLQDMLGEIHDSDITLQYLRGSKSEIAKRLAEKEASSRDRLYQEFISSSK
ncbi:MAG: CHAD domain-containing protein [Nitrososphaera sp.]|nr:CHAD domain-containing protein [Nitrososphaera sp.]